MKRIGFWRHVSWLTVLSLDKGTEHLSWLAAELSRRAGIDPARIMSGTPTVQDEIAHYTLSCPHCDYAVRVDVRPFMSLESIRVVHHDILHLVEIVNIPLERQG